MAEWVGNNVYIVIEDGNLGAPVTTVADQWKVVKLEPKVDKIDTTRGANKSYKMSQPGMIEYSLSITLGIDDGDITPDHLQINQVYTVTVAPNGNTSGQPMHKGTFYLESIPLDVETDKGERTFQTKWTQEDAPSTDIFMGGVVP